MSKKRGRAKFGRGTFVERDLFTSKAFLALNGAAPQVLLIFLGKRYFENVNSKHICTNKNSLHFTYIEAEKEYKLTKTRFRRAIDTLLAHGFITVNHQGGGYQQDKTVYGLSESWRLWHPGLIIEKRKIDTCQKGFRKPKKTHKKQIQHSETSPSTHRELRH